MSLIKYLQILKCTQTCNVQALIFTHNISILLFINGTSLSSTQLATNFVTVWRTSYVENFLSNTFMGIQC